MALPITRNGFAIELAAFVIKRPIFCALRPAIRMLVLTLLTVLTAPPTGDPLPKTFVATVPTVLMPRPREPAARPALVSTLPPCLRNPHSPPKRTPILRSHLANVFMALEPSFSHPANEENQSIGFTMMPTRPSMRTTKE